MPHEFLRERVLFILEPHQCPGTVCILCGPASSYFYLVYCIARHKPCSWVVLFLLKELQCRKVNWDLLACVRTASVCRHFCPPYRPSKQAPIAPQANPSSLTA